MRQIAIASVIFAVVLILAMIPRADARDPDGRYQQSDHHDWVRALHSPAGTWCCDISDGHALVDADWRSRDGHYQVRLLEQWLDVPDSAVIGEPNLIGQTVVWFIYSNGTPLVNCFLPGAMT